MKLHASVILIFTATLFMGGCKYFSSDDENLKPVARVFDKYLYREDLLTIVPPGTSKQDSEQIANTYIDNWIKQNVIIAQAEENLSEEQKNFELQVENYRNSLLIYNYERNLIEQKLDTNFSDDELMAYFQKNPENFKLHDYLFKLYYVKIDAGNRKGNIQNLIRSNRAEDIEELRHFCTGNAIDYAFSEDWISGSELNSKIPLNENQKSDIASSGKTSLLHIGKFDYYVYTLQSYGPGQLPPFAVVKDEIKQRVLNNRKVGLIEKMRTDLLNDALNNKNAETY